MPRRYNAQPSRYGLAILRGLQSKHVCQGTVPDGVVEQRRIKNRAARAARRAGRAK